MERIPPNYYDSVFIIHTRSSELQRDIHKGVAAECRQLGIYVWDYPDWEFERPKIVDNPQEGSEPDRRALLKLWEKCAALVILYENDDVSVGIEFELETIKRDIYGPYWGARPLIPAISIGSGIIPPIDVATFVAIPRENAKGSGFINECAAMCFLCWTIHSFRKRGVLGAFLLSQASQDSPPLRRLIRDSSDSREFDFPEYAKENIRIKERLPALSQEDSELGWFARRDLETYTEELPSHSRPILDWLLAHELDGHLCKMGGMFAGRTRRNYADACQRFGYCTGFWLRGQSWMRAPDK